MQKMTHRLTEDLRRLEFEHHDNCVSCGYEFKKGDTSHLGYNSKDEPLYVCDDCAKNLKETAVRHYFSPLPYEVPNKNSQLWRYMDFSKYVSLLSTSDLYFARADCFEDHFEGAKGVMKNKNEWDSHYLSFFKQAIKHPPEGYICEKTDEEVEKEAQRLLKDLEEGGKYSRERVFISCWHENEFESEAMWKLYSSYLDNAIAIKTTYSSLYISLGKDPSISIGRVRYIDFTKNFAGVNDSFWRKRKSFSHENEVRAIIHDHECGEKGKLMNCNLTTLIEEVYLSPKAPSWFGELIKDVNGKYDLSVKVNQSKLNENPFF